MKRNRFNEVSTKIKFNKEKIDELADINCDLYRKVDELEKNIKEANQKIDGIDRSFRYLEVMYKAAVKDMKKSKKPILRELYNAIFTSKKTKDGEFNADRNCSESRKHNQRNKISASKSEQKTCSD
jgi:predicted nuclease with TOPRIM domain